MKKIILSILLALATSFALVTSAGVSAQPRFAQPGWFGDLGLEGYHYNYRERSYRDNSFLMKDTGPMYGLYYGLGYQPECIALRIALEGEIAWGDKIHYQSKSSGESSNEKYVRSELRLLGFYPWALSEQLTLEGYMGLGGRYVENDGWNTITTTGHVGYLRESTYSYAPIGIRIIKDLDCCMYLIGYVEYDWFLSGHQYSGLQGGVNNTQDSGYGARLGLDLHIPSSFQAFDYNVGMFVRHWNIKDSSINTSNNGRFTGLEPRNRTYEIGVKVGLVF